MYWHRISTDLKLIAAGSRKVIWGINLDDQIVYYDADNLVPIDGGTHLDVPAWTPAEPLPNSLTPLTLDCAADGTVLCIASNNVLYRYNAINPGWISIGESNPSCRYKSVAVANNGSIYLVNVDGHVWYYVGEGYFEQITGSRVTPANVQSVTIGDKDALFMLGSGDFAYRWDDLYSGTTQMSSGGNTFKLLSASSPSDIMAVSTDDKFYNYAGEGAWEYMGDFEINYLWNPTSDEACWALFNLQNSGDSVIQMSHDRDGTCYCVTERTNTDGSKTYFSYIRIFEPVMTCSIEVEPTAEEV